MNSNRTFALAVVLVVGVAIVYMAFGLMTAQHTLGCDFAAYQLAVERYLDGQSLYDLTATKTG